MEPLKNIYSSAFFDDFGANLESIYPAFNSLKFKDKIFDENWDNLELKGRMRHISTNLHSFLPNNFPVAANILVQLIQHILLKKDPQSSFSLHYMFVPDYIEIFGKQNFEVSLKAMEQITLFTSCEFAIRPFIINNFQKGMQQMLAWSKHKNHHVRRLASEGCRPRLPWSIALPELKKDPTLILPILENLKNDTSEYVRKSVANNLNDISKDNPEIVISIFKKWKGFNQNTDKLIKHAARTLLKAANSEALKIFGYGNVDKILIESFKIINPSILFGTYLSFQFQMTNKADKNLLIRLEYAIYYQKANGNLSKKVYKISEKEYAPSDSRLVERKQAFKKITTRTFHPGLHQIALVVNGVEFPKHDFNLSM